MGFRVKAGIYDTSQSSTLSTVRSNKKNSKGNAKSGADRGSSFRTGNVRLRFTNRTSAIFQSVMASEFKQDGLDHPANMSAILLQKKEQSTQDSRTRCEKEND